VHRGFLRFVARRVAAAAVLVLLVSSSALLLSRLSPVDTLAGFDVDPVVAEVECARTRCRDPLWQQYAMWLGRAARFDLGDSLRYQRPVRDLISERASNSLVLGLSALIIATLIGIPAGVLTGSRPGGSVARGTRAGSALLLSLPPLLAALALLVFASRTGLFPVGGMAPSGASLLEQARHLLLPALALALPMAATLERLQSRAMADAVGERCVLAAAARGVSRRRLIWRHAWKLSLKPVLGIYGIVIGSLLSGAFAVEYVMSWPGLGALTYEALVARDSYLVAGCAAAGSISLAIGILATDIALAAVDPRLTEPA
jgi:peptide/nickel transport system permease protein